jgi:4-carboxymuconolactone decarboxylase
MHSIIFSSILMVTMVISPYAAAQDRMPPLGSEQMNEAQRKAAAEVAAGPRGGVIGPFVPLLRSPEFMSRLQKTGEYLRFHSALGARLNELVILLTARRWTQQFEWHAHYPIALKAGVTGDVAQAIAEGRRPVGMAEDEEVVYDFCDELFRTQGVSDTTYARAVTKLREQGVIDMLGVAGYYSMLAMIMNVARTPLPDGAMPPLKAFPR